MGLLAYMAQHTSNDFIFFVLLLTALFSYALYIEYKDRHKTWTTKELEDEFRRKNGLKRK